MRSGIGKGLAAGDFQCIKNDKCIEVSQGWNLELKLKLKSAQFVIVSPAAVFFILLNLTRHPIKLKGMCLLTMWLSWLSFEECMNNCQIYTNTLPPAHSHLNNQFLDESIIWNIGGAKSDWHRPTGLARDLNLLICSAICIKWSGSIQNKYCITWMFLCG